MELVKSLMYCGEPVNFKYNKVTGELMMLNRVFNEWEYFNGSERQKRTIIAMIKKYYK